MISITNERNETTVVGPTGTGVVLTEKSVSVRVGGTGWRAGIGYRGPQSITSDSHLFGIPDYVLVMRLVSLAFIIISVSIRRFIK